MVLAELHHGKFPLVKLPAENPPSSKSPVVNSPAEYSAEENSPTENFPVFINAFLSMKRELVIA